MIYEQSAFLDAGFLPGKNDMLLKTLLTIMILIENNKLTTTIRYHYSTVCVEHLLCNLTMAAFTFKY